MKSISLGLAFGLLGGVALGGAAMAQTPPPPSPPPTLKQPAAGPTPAAPPPPAQPGQQSAQNGQPAMPTPSGPPEGMIVETPNGFYLVRPGEPNPQRLDLGRGGMGHPMVGQNGPAAMTEGDDTMGDMEEDGMQPPPPHPHRPPHPPEGKGARIHIHTPNLDVNVKCPDDEPLKACVDAISQLVDKSNMPSH